MPKAHGRAETKGRKTGEAAAAILARGQHPESGRRACLGLMRMGERHGGERLEAACARALAINNPTLRSVEAILKSRLEKVALAEEMETKPVVHENIRGGDYFDRGESTSNSEEERSEARYLEEERQSIIHEPTIDASAGDARRRREETMTAPLSARIERRKAGDRGGDDTQTNEDASSFCTSQSTCVAVVINDDGPLRRGEDVSSREGVYEGMMCEVDEGWDAPCDPRRGEV